MIEAKNQGRVLALDVGERRIGIALSDPLRIISSPHPAINRGGKREYQELIALILEQGVTDIAVGLPLELDGTIGEQAEKVLHFQRSLDGRLRDIPETRAVRIHKVDERFTTDEADRYVRGTKSRGSDRRAERDSVAASLILENFLAGRNE